MKSFEQRSKDSYNKKAKEYEKTFDGRFTVKFKKMLYDVMEVPQNASVLDVACGNGRFLKMLTEKGLFQGFGVDISENMIEEAEKLNPNMNFYVAGCETLPFEENTMDVMTVCAAFHHFPNVEKFAKEAKRVMKQDGVIYIAEVYLPAVLRIICNPFVRFSRAGDVKFYSSKEIKYLFEKNDFLTEQVLINGTAQLIKPT